MNTNFGHLAASSPDSPTIQTYEQTDKNYILLSWSPGSANGAVVVSFLVQCFRNDSFGTTLSETVPASKTSIVLDQLIADVQYLVTVTTQSSNYGNSEPSQPVMVVLRSEASPSPSPSPSSSPSSSPGTPTPRPSDSTEPDSSPPTGVVVGLVIGLLALASIAVGAFVYWRRRRSTSGAIRLDDDIGGRGRGHTDADLSLLNPASESGEDDINVSTGFDEDAHSFDDDEGHQ